MTDRQIIDRVWKMHGAIQDTNWTGEVMLIVNVFLKQYAESLVIPEGPTMTKQEVIDMFEDEHDNLMRVIREELK